MFPRGRVLVLALSFAVSAHAQPPAPVSTYKIRVGTVIKGRDGLPFDWVLAPDNSLLISLGHPGGRWSIRRIRHWETPSPKEEGIEFADDFSDRRWGVFGKPLLDPAGDYLVFRVVHPLAATTEASGRWRQEAVIAVIDLRTFKLVSRTKSDGDLASGTLAFNRDGTLMVKEWKYNYGAKPDREVTLLSLPKLETVAACDYTVEEAPAASKTADHKATITTSRTCPATLVSALHESAGPSPPDPVFDPKFENLAGPNCLDAELDKTQTLALFHCGSEHLTDADGFFGITFWKALKVLSVPDGKTLLAVPLHFYDGKSRGLFAQAN